MIAAIKEPSSEIWIFDVILKFLYYCSQHVWAGMLLFIGFPVLCYLIYWKISNVGLNKRVAANDQFWEDMREYVRKQELLEGKDYIPQSEVYERVRKAITDEDEERRIYEELHDDLVAVFGENYKELFPLNKRKVASPHFPCPANNDYWTRLLLLSHKGYTSSLLNGIGIGGIDDVDRSLAFCKRIEMHLMEHHPELGDDCRLYLERKNAPNITTSVFHEYDVTKELLKNGSLRLYGGCVYLKLELVHNHRNGFALWENQFSEEQEPATKQSTGLDKLKELYDEGVIKPDEYTHIVKRIQKESNQEA